MRVLITYESMYGNTHRVAEAISEGFGPDDEVTVAPVADLAGRPDVDLVIVGAPTHAHGLPRPATRRSALDSRRTPDKHHRADPGVNLDYGVREWLKELPATLEAAVATYDTRFPWPAWLVGHPARMIARSLSTRGATLLAKPESFFLDKQEILRPSELDRARRWGTTIREIAMRAGTP